MLASARQPSLAGSLRLVSVICVSPSLCYLHALVLELEPNLKAQVGPWAPERALSPQCTLTTRVTGVQAACLDARHTVGAS